mmetsp:Transcript_79137/g.191756  ORF Transcript_79137/g.191756 Transcript_79137/m.191756 type:complete len:225 (+) Transcript_79137:165-839(+)
MITSDPHSLMTRSGVLYCCPNPSPPPPSCTPGVICTSPRDHAPFHAEGLVDMNPMTKSGCFAAIAIASSVYWPFAIVPALDISARSNNPRPFGSPTCFKPSMMPAPGTMCAFVMCDQSAILCTPEEYCPTTVFPMSANLRSSKIMKSCFAASSRSVAPNASSKSGYKSQCVFRMQISGPILSASAMSSFAVPTSAATHKLVFFLAMRFHKSFAHLFSVSVARCS